LFADVPAEHLGMAQVVGCVKPHKHCMIVRL